MMSLLLIQKFYVRVKYISA